MHLFIQQEIKSCDTRIESALQSFTASKNDGIIEPAIPQTPKAKTKHHPRFNTRNYLSQIHGVDVLDIYGISPVSYRFFIYAFLPFFMAA